MGSEERLRKASIDMEACLLMMCVILAFSVPLFAADVAVLGVRSEDVPAYIPGLACGTPQWVSLGLLEVDGGVANKCV